MSKYLLSILLFLTSCARSGEAPTPSLTLREQLEQRHNTYTTLLPNIQGPSGFIDTDHCDSVLFSSLIAATGVDTINIIAAEDPEHPGRWYRRPVSLPECYSTGASRSTISRDMLIGVMWYAWAQRDLPLLERMWDYGEARDWFMGDDSAGGFHTQMVPIVPLLAREIYALGGIDHQIYRRLPLTSSRLEGMTGFEAHLQILQLLLDAEVSGEPTTEALQRFQEQAGRQPGNPLFQYAMHRWTDGQLDGAARLLLNEQYWPSTRLPTAADRCSGWVLERDIGTDWMACDTTRTHSGGDFLFASWLILKQNQVDN